MHVHQALGLRSRRGRLRAIDALTLAAVALVVLLVSLPRLADMAVRENESDALWLVRHLATLELEVPATSLQELLAGAPGLERQLDDAEFLENGRLLRRHGYLFALIATQPGSAADCAITGVRAWPWQYERTGRAAFLWRCGEEVRTHANQQAQWSGPQHAPTLLAEDAGWSAVKRP